MTHFACAAGERVARPRVGSGEKCDRKGEFVAPLGIGDVRVAPASMVSSLRLQTMWVPKLQLVQDQAADAHWMPTRSRCSSACCSTSRCRRTHLHEAERGKAVSAERGWIVPPQPNPHSVEAWVERHRRDGHHLYPAPTAENPERWECKCDPDAPWTAVWRILTLEQIGRKFAHLARSADPAGESPACSTGGSSEWGYPGRSARVVPANHTVLVQILQAQMLETRIGSGGAASPRHSSRLAECRTCD